MSASSDRNLDTARVRAADITQMLVSPFRPGVSGLINDQPIHRSAVPSVRHFISDPRCGVVGRRRDVPAISGSDGR